MIYPAKSGQIAGLGVYKAHVKIKALLATVIILYLFTYE